MKENICPSDQTLLLLHYGEPCEVGASQHLENCLTCQERLAVLRQDLKQLPEENYEVDDLAGQRMAARVTEQLQKRQGRFWLPTIGASAAAALVLVLTMTSTPPPEVSQVVHTPAPAVINFDLSEDMPDIDFLEDMELIRELELLAQLEGV